MSKNFYVPLFLAATLVFTGCDDDDDDVTNMTPPNEEELITTVEYRLSPILGGEDKLFLFQDLDGDGGQDPIITTDTLVANTVYSASAFFFNETEDPVEDITEEIEEEDLEHQLFFQIIDTAVITGVDYADADSLGNPVGLSSVLSTGTAGGTDFTVILRHEPDKDATGVAQGDITNAGGETDIQVVFPVIVE